jgi:ankyrin repeat protein
MVHTKTFQALEQRQHDDHRVHSLGGSLGPDLLAPSRPIEPSLSLGHGRKVLVADLQPSSSARSSDPDTSILSDGQRKEIMTSLHFKQRDARLLTLKSAQAKTCRWMLKNVLYRDWMEAEKLYQHRGFFWIKGKPGAGKSIMMKFLFSEAKRKMKGCLVLSFFFNARGEDFEKSTAGLYRSLLLQLLEKVPETWDIFDHYGISGETIENIGWQNETLRELFALSLQRLGNQRVMCFVDALDECPEDDIRDMISHFEELGELEKAAEFRVCFSSRHYPEISIQTGLQLVLESEQEHTNDITLYVDTHLKLGRSSQAEDIKAEILRKSSGIFLWVNLVIPILNKEFDRGRIKALKKRLAEIPAGLHNLFLDMLTRDLKNVDYFIVCLQVILFAARPLGPDEFRIAIETCCEDDYAPGTCDSTQMTSENLRKFVLDTSKGLAEITRSKDPTVQFIHESVRDFLLKEGGLNELQSATGNTATGDPQGLGHNTLKNICLLQLTSFCYDGNRKDDDGDDRPHWKSDQRQNEFAKGYPLLRYAVEYVLYHANWAQSFKLDQTSFLETFDMRAWTLARTEVRIPGFSFKESSHLLYYLSESGSAELIRICPGRNQHLLLQGGQYEKPLLAALFAGHSAAARALVDLPPLTEEDLTKEAQAKPHRNLTLKKENFKRTRHILSFLCEFGDTDMLRVMWESKQLTMDTSVVKQCFVHASSEAVVDTLVEMRACEYSPNYIVGGRNHDSAVFSSLHDRNLLTLPNLKSALKECPSLVNDSEFWGQSSSLLEYAAARGFDRIAKLCAKDTSELNKKDAIVSALRGRINQSGRASIIEYLVHEGVQVDFTLNKFITTLLFDMICRPYNEEVVASLFTTPFLDLETKNSEGLTALFWAIRHGRKAYVKLCLSAGSDPRARSNDGATALIHATKLSDLSSFRCILEHAKCEPNAQDKDGRTALSWCAILADECAIAMVVDLVKRPDADPNWKECSGHTVLMRAVNSGNPKLVEALLRSNAIDPDLGSKRKSAPLRLAIKLYSDSGSQVFWKISRILLLTFKVNPDNRQKLPTPTELAVKSGFVQIVKLLERTSVAWHFFVKGTEFRLSSRTIRPVRYRSRVNA